MIAAASRRCEEVARRPLAPQRLGLGLRALGLGAAMATPPDSSGGRQRRAAQPRPARPTTLRRIEPGLDQHRDQDRMRPRKAGTAPGGNWATA